MSTVSKKSAEHYRWGSGCDGWHLLKTDQLSVIEESMPAGCCENRHFHQKAQQFFYVLSGSLVIETNGTDHEIVEGAAFHVAAGMQHQVFNRSDEVAKFLVISNPKSHGDRIEA